MTGTTGSDKPDAPGPGEPDAPGPGQPGDPVPDGPGRAGNPEPERPDASGPGGPGDPAPAGPGGRDDPGPDQRRPSGLRNPRRAVQGLGVATLLLEALSLLLAVQPLRVLGAPTSAVVSVLVLAGLAVVLAGFLRFRVTWYLVGLLNLAVALTGFFQWALGVLGVVFALVWWYVLHVRRAILGE